jgi:hypothetical protein
MQSVKAVLVANTRVDTVEEFKESQDLMNEPMVLFLDEHTNECLNHFRIVAEDYEELQLMFELKVFYTSSVPNGETKWLHGAVFYGVDPQYKEKERTAI